MTENDAKTLYDRATNRAKAEDTRVVHVRAMGRSRDIAFELLRLGTDATDETIRQAVAQFMEVSPTELRDTVIERHENGNMTLRPEAVFG